MLQAPAQPGTFPGLPDGYVTAELTATLASLMNKYVPTCMYLMAAVMIAVMVLQLSGALSLWKITFKQVFVTSLVAILILFNYKLVFGLLVSLGYNFGETIIEDKGISMLWDHFNQDSINAQVQTAGDKGGTGVMGFAQTLKDMMSVSYYSTTASILVCTLCVIIFTLATYVITGLWLVLLMLLFVIGPFLLVLSPIPKIGPKITANFLGTLLELSLWQVWMHLCTWIITATSSMAFVKLTQVGDTSGTFGAGGTVISDTTQTNAMAAGMCVVYTVLYIATPIMVHRFVPLGSGGLIAGDVLSKVTSAVTTVMTVGGGAVMGAAAGRVAAQAAGKGAGGQALGMIRGAGSGVFNTARTTSQLSKANREYTRQAKEQARENAANNKPQRRSA